MSLSYSFAGKNVLITGGGQGIGRQLVQRFHDGGANVFTLDKNPDSVKKLKDELPKVTAEVVDLTDWEATKGALESFGSIDHLVNNAGIILPQPFMSVTEESAFKLYGVHVGAAINVSQFVAKGMIERGSGGSIVNICSMSAKKYTPGCAAYGAAKAALENLTKSMAVELGSHNIRVNCVVCGLIKTPMNQNPAAAKYVEQFVQNLVIKRPIEPDEVADLVLFLLSSLSATIVGESVVIDCGWALK